MKADCNKIGANGIKKYFFKLCLQEKLWKYRGEGNANLVISLPLERLILRLHKSDKDKEVTYQDALQEEQRVWREEMFCRCVMVPLLGSAYIQPPKLAHLDSEDLKMLGSTLKPFRPSYRLHKCIKFGYITIYPDYALLPLRLKLENHNDAKCKTRCCKTLLPLQIVKNGNYISNSTPNSNLLNVKPFRSSNIFASDDSNCKTETDSFTSDDDDDIFVDNLNNINNSIDIPTQTKFRNMTTGYCHQLTPPILENDSSFLRRYSTGSDFNAVADPKLSGAYDIYTSMVSSSAPIHQRAIPRHLKLKNPVFCVEIKPKQGWIPLTDRRYPKCVFCMNQYLKLNKGLVDSISNYCPLDLFSGNITRIKNALKNLLSTPQNNLKLFRDGFMIYSEDLKSDLFSVLNDWFDPPDEYLSERKNLFNLIQRFCSLIADALTSDLTEREDFPKISDVDSINEKNSRCEDFLLSSNNKLKPCGATCKDYYCSFMTSNCDWMSQPLPHNCILDRILKIQQLEQSGTDLVYKTYKKLYNENDDYGYVDKLCANSDGVLSLDLVQRYLLATTAKDCSILIAFQKINCDAISDVSKTHIIKDLDGINYAWNIGISDLDPKPLSSIEKHRKRDADVLSAYLHII